MEIVDAQIHSWEPVPSHPWEPVTASPQATGKSHAPLPFDRVLAAMDAVGVAAALLHTSPNYREKRPDGTYRYYNQYAELAAKTHPARFASITHIDHRAADLDAEVAALRGRPGTLAIRVVFREYDLEPLRAGAYRALFAAAGRHRVPVFVYLSGYLPDAVAIAREHPDLLLIIDHFGLLQPPLRTPDSPPWQRLPELLALAAYPNVAVKFSGAPTLSEQRYPYRDVWPHLHQVIERFGLDRLMWASDFTRCAEVNTYAEGLFFLLHTDELSASDKEKLLGTTARTLLRWPASDSEKGTHG